MPQGGARKARLGIAAPPGCVAVIDIGSNSLRLVIYDGIRRSPRTLFNEKVMCGLGRNLERTGKLDAEGVALARPNMRRFVALARSIGVARLDVLATAAVRDASDGSAFVEEIERTHGLEVTVLSGAEEGRLSAFGVIAGIPEASGIAGDLGGGSVELVPLAGGQVGPAATLPIGPLRLVDRAEDDRSLRDVIDSHLASVPWLDSRIDGGAFYAVGGAWRALARIHMEQTRYPLHIVQQYRISRREAEDFLELIARLSRKSLEKVTGISRKRLDVVPVAARILHRLLRRIAPKHLVFSAFGLREGHLYGLLDEAEQAADPLLAGCAELAESMRRFGADGEEVFAWAAPLFAGKEDEGERRRLRLAAALLSDIAWDEHPDYRPEQAMRRVLYMPTAGISHEGRAYLAAAIEARYGGPGQDLLSRLLDDDTLADARRYGLALRLGCTLSGGVRGALSGNRLALEDGRLVLEFSPEGASRYGESVQRRLDALGRSLGKRTEVRGV